MARTQLRGDSQIMQGTIDLLRLITRFITGDWNITDGNNDATITGLRDPTNPQDAATKAWVESVIPTVPTEVWSDCVTGTHGSPTVTLSNTNILSGTERIYLNGIRQREGATNDYTIVYATGVVTFTFNLKNTPGQADEVCADYQL
jgi:hypothetical protein